MELFNRFSTLAHVSVCVRVCGFIISLPMDTTVNGVAGIDSQGGLRSSLLRVPEALLKVPNRTTVVSLAGRSTGAPRLPPPPKRRIIHDWFTPRK